MDVNEIVSSNQLYITGSYLDLLGDTYCIDQKLDLSIIEGPRDISDYRLNKDKTLRALEDIGDNIDDLN